MLKAVYFVEETPAAAACHGRTVAEEMERAVQSLRGMGFEILSFNYFQGERELFSKNPVAKPEDLKGQRIRSQAPRS